MLASRETPGSRRACAPPPPADEVDTGGNPLAGLAPLDFGEADECRPWAEHRGGDRRLPPAASASAGPASSVPQQPGSPFSFSWSANAADDRSDPGGEVACSATSSSEARRPSSPSTGPSTPTTAAPSGSGNSIVPCLRIQSPGAVGEEWQCEPPNATAKDLRAADSCSKDGEGGDGLDAIDDDADDYVSCCTGPPSPLCSLSPVSCDKEASGRSEGLSEDLVFDDFASSLGEENFDGCHDAFDTFAAGGARSAACEGIVRSIIFEPLSVAEVDFQKLIKIVLDSALSLYDLPSERSPCPAAPCDVGFPKGSNQSASHSASPSDRLGSDSCVELLNWFTSAPPLVNSKGEALAKFEWKSSVLCKLYVAAVNPSSHVDDRRFWMPSPTGSKSVRQVEGLRTPDASDGGRMASARSAGAGKEAATPFYQNAGAAGFPPPSPMRSAVSQSCANAAAIALSAASRPKHLDLKHAELLCSISKAAFMKRSAEELGVLRDHYAEVLKHAVAHLRHWLDSKEQAVMDSEMNHKVIETLVLQAQKAVGENLTVGRDAKRRKPKSVRSTLKPPKVKQGERTIGWRIPL